VDGWVWVGWWGVGGVVGCVGGEASGMSQSRSIIIRSWQVIVRRTLTPSDITSIRVIEYE